MVRMLISFGIQLLSNAIGIVAAAVLLEQFELSGAAFVIAVVVFTLASLVLSPLVMKTALKYQSALLSASALVTALLGLIITDVVSDGLSISGWRTWVLAPMVIWLVALVAAVILPIFLVKKALDDDDNDKGPTVTTFSA